MAIDKLTNLKIDENIDVMFNSFKDNITIKASVNSYKIWDHCLRVKMIITIDDFRTWLNNNYPEGKQSTRLLWYKFLDYLKPIIDYGYHFKNVQQINRFTDIPDDVIAQVASKNKYNITCSAEVCFFEESNDRNSCYFTLLAEAFLQDEDPDEDIVARPYPSNNEINTDVSNEIDIEEKDVLDKLIEELPDSDNELLQKQLDEYSKNGVNSAEIADVLRQKKQAEKTNVELFHSIDLLPRATAHTIINNQLTVKFALTKRAFIEVFSAARELDNYNDVWNEFTADVINNSSNYNNWDKNGNALSLYLLKNNLRIQNQELNLRDAYVDNNNQVLRFFSDVVFY